MTVQRKVIPDGYVAFGWHSYTGAGLSAQARLSVAHLAEAEQGDRPWQGVCGVRRRGRATVRDSPKIVDGEVRRGERRLCARCQRMVEVSGGGSGQNG